MNSATDKEKDSLTMQENKDMGFYGVAGNYKVVFSPTMAEKDKMHSDTNETKTEKNWLKRLTKDPELFEATRVIGDMK